VLVQGKISKTLLFSLNSLGGMILLFNYLLVPCIFISRAGSCPRRVRPSPRAPNLIRPKKNFVWTKIFFF
jgi:hypothetical protein